MPKMCTVEKCCGSCNLHTGCIVIALINILQSILGSAVSFFSHLPESMIFLNSALGLIMVITSIIYLWFGVKKQAAWASKMYIAINAILLIASFIQVIMALISGQIMSACFAIIGALLYFYFIVVVYSYMKKGVQTTQ